MVGVMRLEPDRERRRGHMGLIMAQLSDSETVFIDPAQAGILWNLASFFAYETHTKDCALDNTIAPNSYML